MGTTRRIKFHKTNSDGSEFTSTRVSSVAACAAALALENDRDGAGGVIVDEWWRDAKGKKWGKTVETNPG